MARFRARILLVDDEQGIRNLLSNEFTAQGYSVDSCSNGDEAIQCLRQEKYDVIITDIKMPGSIDGLQLLAAAKKISPETEVIVVTGFATVENAVLSMKEGAYDFIQKPFELDEISILVEKALEKSELKTMLALYAGYRAVYSSFKLEELFPHMTGLLRKVVRADEIALLLRDYQGQFYLASASFSLVDHPFKDAFITLAEQLCRSAADTQGPVIMNTDAAGDVQSAPLLAVSGVKSLLLHPITLKEKNLGMLIIARTGECAEFNAADQRSVSIFTSLIAQSIANSKLYEQLHNKITELENTRSRMEDISRQLPRLVRAAEQGRQTADIFHKIEPRITAGITSCDSFMQSGHSLPLPEFMAQVHQEARSALALLSNFEWFSLPGAQSTASTGIREAIADVTASFAAELKKHSITLTSEVDPGLPDIVFDAERIRQVISNIFANACEAIVDRGNDAVFEKKIVLRAFRTEAGVQLEICDNAGALEQHSIEKIFEPYFTTKADGRHPGLGLSVVRKIMDQHGGTVQANCAPRNSTSFILSFPIHS